MIACNKCGSKDFKIKSSIMYEATLQTDGLINRTPTVEAVDWIKCAKCNADMSAYINGWEGIDF